MSQRTIFCFKAVLGNLHVDLRNIYCCCRHIFALERCCATFIIYILETDVQQKKKQRMHCCVYTATMVTHQSVRLYCMVYLVEIDAD